MTEKAKAKFMQNAGSFFPTTDQALNIKDALPPGNFIIQMTPQKQLYFEKVADFDLPSKMYGDTDRRTRRILNTFLDRDASTGALLTGEKGSGKTLQAKKLCCEAAYLGIPTIIINAPWCGDEFNKLIQDIQQPCCILFDEFEKTYDREQQEKILTLLDGVFPSKKLFILTCNDKFRIDSHMTNRPGRLYYAIEYAGLKAEFIEEYCNDELDDKSHIPAVCAIASTFGQFNFDLLKALVEEMNRYKEDPYQAIEMLNASPDKDNEGRYSIDLTVNGEKTRNVYIDGHYGGGYGVLKGNPLAVSKMTLAYRFVKEKEEDESGDDPEVIFFQGDISEIKPQLGRFVYDDGKGAIAVFTRIIEDKFSYSNIKMAF